MELKVSTKLGALGLGVWSFFGATAEALASRCKCDISYVYNSKNYSSTIYSPCDSSAPTNQLSCAAEGWVSTVTGNTLWQAHCYGGGGLSYWSQPAYNVLAGAYYPWPQSCSLVQ